MKVTRDVIEDLLPAYLAGEASRDTAALVDEFLRQDAELARTVAGLRSNPLPEVPVVLSPTQEKETLMTTKRLLFWQGILMGLALFLTLLPLSFQFGEGGVRWVFLEGPLLQPALILLAALACWGGYLYVRRRLQGTSL